MLAFSVVELFVVVAVFLLLGPLQAFLVWMILTVGLLVVLYWHAKGRFRLIPEREPELPVVPAAANGASIKSASRRPIRRGRGHDA